MVRTSTIIIRTIARIIAGAARISAIIFITVGAPLADPRGAALAQGDIFVADQSALGGQGAVIRIDPANGTQKSVAAGKMLIHRAGLPSIAAAGYSLPFLKNRAGSSKSTQ